MRRSSMSSVLALSLSSAPTVVPDAIASQVPVGEIRVASMSALLRNTPPRTVKPGHTPAACPCGYAE